MGIEVGLRAARAAGVAAALSSCDYEAPVDEEGEPLGGAISGSVLYAGPGLPSTTFVTLFSALDPAPPDGTGSPLTFAAVGEEQFTAPTAGLRSAPFALTALPPGEFYVNALMDVDGDFNPFSSTLAGATCGDWGGTYLKDLVSQEAATIEVKDGQVADQVSVLVGQEFTIERPTFRFAGESTLSLGAILGGTPPLFRLETTPVGAAFSAGTPDGADPFTLSLGPSCAPLPDPPAPYPACADLPTCGCDPATLAPCGTALYLWLVDADADGVVDPDPDPDLAAAGIFDVWPRVYLEFTGELATFEHEGRILPERWVSQAFPLLGEAVTVATQSAYAGYPISPAQAAGLLGAPVGTPTPLHSLSVTFTPVFVHYHADGVLVDPAKGPYDVVDLGAGGVLPPEVLGAWAVTLVSFTGQTWTLPNDIGLLGLPSIDPLFDPTTQAVPLYLVE